MEDNTMPKKSPLSMQIDVSRFEKATEEEKRQQDVMSESTTFFKDGMRKLMKNPLAVASMIVLILIIVIETYYSRRPVVAGSQTPHIDTVITHNLLSTCTETY